MPPARPSRNAEASGSRTPGANLPRKPRKKPKSPQLDASPRLAGPLPMPYLATAPKPVSSLTPSRIDELANQRSGSALVLPSSYNTPRPTTSQSTGRKKKYASGLLAPPAIMPGGTSASPRVQALFPPQATRRRSADRVGVGGLGGPGAGGSAMVENNRGGLSRRQRSEERLRDIGAVNSSMMSLGHLGQILESDPQAPPPDPPVTRRRRRVVRGDEETGLRRRPTVSTREDGRAMGLARGASMRRTNVWDDLPESSDPPPAFPFPASTAGRLPPAFEAEQAPRPPEPPRSPPPTFDQAMALTSPPARETPLSRPTIVINTVLPVVHDTEPQSPSSPVSQYASAPSSPVLTAISVDDVETEVRDDRRMWNADILAGYTLAERVERELSRRRAEQSIPDQEAESSSPRSAPTSKANKSVMAASTEARADGEPSRSYVPTLSVGGPSPDESIEATRDPQSEEPIALPNELQATAEAVTEDPVIHNETPGLPLSPSAASVNTTRAATSAIHQDKHEDDDVEPTSEAVSSAIPDEKTSETKSNAGADKTPVPVHEPINSASGIESSAVTDEDVAKLPAVVETSTEPAPRSRVDDTVPTGLEPPAAPEATLDSRSQAGSDRIIAHSPPTRKLTRGKAVRRSPSNSTATMAPNNGSIRSKRHSLHSKPLFSGPGYTAEDLQIMTEPVRVSLLHRLSAPALMNEQGPSTKEEDAGRRISESAAVPTAAKLPPHREAALRRRESALTRLEPKRPSLQQVSMVKSTPAIVEHLTPTHTGGSMPLIDLRETWPLDAGSPTDMGKRPISIATAELLQLLEHDPLAAETSMQGAAKAAELQPSADAGPSEPVGPKKKAPPPPPPSRGLSRRLSILSTADSPITPHIPPRPESITSERLAPPPLPTRRPPPAPPLPRLDSSRTTSSVSSISSQPEVISRPPPPWTSRTSLSARPRGPRPPPIPPRPWAKVAAAPPSRPLGDRTQSENPIVLPTSTPSSPTRSTSAQDIAEVTNTFEYTDLDVFVARLQGSGREYEGYAHISAFLGPAKNPAASPEALASLLPSLVLVDSRRVNAAGKVKLKLSLLGVRVTKCPICLSQFREKDRAVMLPDCSHVAHENCANRWFRDNSKCFVCRAPLRAVEGIV